MQRPYEATLDAPTLPAQTIIPINAYGSGVGGSITITSGSPTFQVDYTLAPNVFFGVDEEDWVIGGALASGTEEATFDLPFGVTAIRLQITDGDGGIKWNGLGRCGTGGEPPSGPAPGETLPGFAWAGEELTDLRGHTMTPVGGADIATTFLFDTGSPKFGTYVLTGPAPETGAETVDVCGITVAGNGDDFVLDGDFTMEFWAYFGGVTKNRVVARSQFVSGAPTGNATAAGAHDWALRHQGGRAYLDVWDGSAWRGGGGSPVGNGWSHFVYQRDVSASKLYFGANGQWQTFDLDATGSRLCMNGPLGASGQGLYLGRGAVLYLATVDDITLYDGIDGIKITKGSMLYDPTAPYTVPAVPFS